MAWLDGSFIRAIYRHRQLYGKHLADLYAKSLRRPAKAGSASGYCLLLTTLRNGSLGVIAGVIDGIVIMLGASYLGQTLTGG